MNEHPTPTGSARGLLPDLISPQDKGVVTGNCRPLPDGRAVLVFYPRTYGSEAKLFVRLGSESVALDPTATQGTYHRYSQIVRE